MAAAARTIVPPQARVIFEKGIYPSSSQNQKRYFNGSNPPIFWGGVEGAAVGRPSTGLTGTARNQPEFLTGSAAPFERKLRPSRRWK